VNEEAGQALMSTSNQSSTTVKWHSTQNKDPAQHAMRAMYGLMIVMVGLVGCKALHYTAPHSSALERTGTHWKVLQCAATHCKALHHNTQYDALQYTPMLSWVLASAPYRTTTYCNTLQNAVTRCNTLQHAATHTDPLGLLRHLHLTALQRAATHCKMLQHAATRCNTLQHAKTQWICCGICTLPH